MNILIAPNSMKGSLNAFDFADTVEKAFLKCAPDFSIRKVPVADGGDFTGEVLRRTLNADEIQWEVRDPLGRKVTAKYAVSGETAIIEMACASGMKLLEPDERNPLQTSSYGTGQLIAHALENGCSEILLGVGGSATVDGGSGMLEALGFRFYDKADNSIPGNGRNLELITRVEKPAIQDKIAIKVISDVENPLLGNTGAASVFGPQKGATPEMVKLLDRGLKNWMNLLERDDKRELAILRGAGAAGGLALPLVVYFNAEIVPGARFILSKLNFEEHVQWADWVITGEGRLDSQTLNDKAPFAVACEANKFGKPVLAVAGNVQQEASGPFDGIFSFINEPLSLDKSLGEARQLLYHFSCELARFMSAFQRH